MRSSFSLSILFGLLLTVAAFGQTQEDLEYRAVLSRQYIQLSRSGRMDEAMAAANRYAEFVEARFPPREHYLASTFVAEALSFQGKYKESIAKWEQMLERLKDFTPRTELEQTIKISAPGDALQAIGVCYSALGQPQEALKYFEAGANYWAKTNHPVARHNWARTQVNIADYYRTQGDYRKAGQIMNVAIAELEPLARAEQTIGPVHHELCLALHIGGEIDRCLDRYDLAEAKLRRALKLRVAENGWEHLDTAKVLDTFVMLYGSQARWAEAEAYGRAELNAYLKSVGPDHIETTTVHMRLAQVYIGQHRYAEAEALLRQVVSRLAKEFGEENPRTTNAQHELAKVLWIQDKYAEAEPLLVKNLAIEEQIYGRDGALLANPITLLANCYISLKRPQEAIALLDRLEGIHKLTPLTPQNLEILHMARAHALWLLGKKEAAISVLDQVLAQEELLLGFASGAERERAEMFINLSSSHAVAIQWQAELKDTAKLFAAIERAKARSFLDELKLKSFDLLAGLSQEERQALAQKEATLRQQLTAAETRLFGLPDLGPNPAAANIEKRRAFSQEVLAARDLLYQHLADVRSASPIYRELILNKAAPASLELVQKQLADGELLLAYFIGDVHSYVICVRHSSAEFFPISLDDKNAQALGVPSGNLTHDVLNNVLLNKTTGLMGMISNPKRKSENPSAKLAAMWTTLIPAEERPKLTSGEVKRLIVIPDGPLALLPFEALVVKNEDEPEYLLDAGPAIAYAPSATILLNLAERKASTATEQKLFTLGDPNYAPPTGADALDRTLGVNRTVDRFRSSLTPLPFTGLEANWIQQNLEKIGFAATKVIGVEATEAAIRRNAPGKQIIHLACHGMADQSYGNFFGALAVAPGRAGDSRDDGYLSMSEIYELNLDGCELAILSACETNYGPQQQGEGVWALSRGFLVAGSRRVVASNWVVDDRAGATLVSYFTNYLAQAGKEEAARDYATALHKAKRQIRKDARWEHPFYWSSLVLVGPK